MATVLGLLTTLSSCSDSVETNSRQTEPQTVTNAANGRFVPDAPDYVVLARDNMPPALTTNQTDEAATSPAETLQRTQAFLERGVDQRDPRWFGYAETILGKLLEARPDHVPAMLQLADLLQKQHRFEASEALYRRIIKLDSESPQPYLSLAMLRRQQGDFPDMAVQCRRLAMLTHPTIVAICVSAAQGLTGSLPASYQRLKAVLQQPLNPAIGIWARIEAAEMAARLNLSEEAELLWTQALTMATAKGQPASAELLAGIADFYLAAGDHERVSELLKSDTSPALMLRQAVAAIHADNTGEARARWQDSLQPWLDSWLERGERTHGAELGLYYHEVAGDQKAALAPALQQWRDRKEPQDLLLLLGILADCSPDELNRSDRLQEISDWMASSGYQDARATALMERPCALDR